MPATLTGMTVTALRATTHHSTGSWRKSTPTLGGTAVSVLDGLDNDTAYAEWIDVAPISNNCLEFFSVNLASLNGGAPIVVTSMRMDFSWRRSGGGGTVTGCAIINTAALDSAGALVRGSDDGRIWGDDGVNYALAYAARPTRYAAADGRSWSTFPTLGFTVEAIWGTGAGAFRIYDVVVHVDWQPGTADGGTTAITATITAPTAAQSIAGPVAVSWTYGSASGRPQTAYEVEITASGANPGLGTGLWASGKITSESARTVTVGVPLVPAGYDAHLRLWSTTAAGQAINSGWKEVAFTVPAVTAATPSNVGAVTFAWSDPKAVVRALEPEPLSPPWRAPSSVEFARSVDGGDWVSLGSAAAWSGSDLETLLKAHDSDYVLMTADDIADNATTWGVAHPAGFAASAALTGGKRLAWGGDHYLWLPALSNNAVSASAAKSYATGSSFNFFADIQAATPAGTTRIASMGNAGYLTIDATNLTFTIFDGLALPAWSATLAQLGFVANERIQIKAALNMATGQCLFYTRPIATDLLLGDGWVLKHTDTTASVAQDGLRDAATATPIIGGATATTELFSGKIFQAALVNVTGGVTDFDFYPNAEIPDADTNYDLGFTNITSTRTAGVTWVLSRSSNATAYTMMAHYVTHGTIITEATGTTDAPLFGADVAGRLNLLTPTVGALTVIVAFRADELNTANATQALFSGSVNGNATGFGIEGYLNSTGNLVVAVGGASAAATATSTIAAVIKEQSVGAAVFNAGVASSWVDGTMSATASYAAVGALPAATNFAVGARAHDRSLRDFGGSVSMVAVLRKALTDAELDILLPYFLAGRRRRRYVNLDDWTAPQHASLLYRARAISADGSKASNWVSSSVVSTPSSGWMLATIAAPGVEPTIIRPIVADVDRTQPEQVWVFDPLPPADQAVVVSSGPQAERLTVTFRTMNRSDRRSLEAFLAGGGPWRLVNSLGQEWVVKQAGEKRPIWIRAMPLPTETTKLRDLHEITVPFVEVEG